MPIRTSAFVDVREPKKRRPPGRRCRVVMAGSARPPARGTTPPRARARRRRRGRLTRSRGPGSRSYRRRCRRGAPPPVEQAAVRRTKAGASDRRVASTASSKRPKRTDAPARKVCPLLQPDPGAGDDAERSLGPAEEPLGRGPGAPCGQPPRLDHPGGRHHRQCLDLLVDMRRTGGVVAAGTRGDPAAERRELERLREVAEREAVRLQLLLERGAEHARFDLRGAGALVDVEHAAEPPEVEADSACEAVADIRLDAADHRGAAAVRDDGDPAARCTSRGSPRHPVRTRAARRDRVAPGIARRARTRSRYDLP